MTPAPALLALALSVQAPAASVAGVVRDDVTGTPVAGAVVLLADLGRGAATAGDGAYLLAGVPAGPQHLTVRAVGYAARTLHALVPASGTVTLDVLLRPEPLPVEGLDVRPRLGLRGLGAGVPEPGVRRVDRAALRADPRLPEPDALLALTGGEVAAAPEAPAGLHVRGGSADHTAYTLDGIPVYSPYHAAGTFSGWNPDALDAVTLAPPGGGGELPRALAGVVAAEVRDPGEALAVEGALGTTQARATVSGPIGTAGAAGSAGAAGASRLGFVVSARAGFPGFASPPGEGSYVRAETADGLARLVAPFLGGRAEALAYDNENELDAAAVAEGAPGDGAPRNAFAWHGRSAGVAWSRAGTGGGARVRAWWAESRASATWAGGEGAPGDPGATALASRRRDAGVSAAVERTGVSGRVAVGFRLARGVTDYRVEGEATVPDPGATAVRTPLAGVFVEGGRALGGGVRVDGTLALDRTAGALWPGPGVTATWRPSPGLALSLAGSRTHQFAQSLRDPESVAGAVFPADLWVGAGDGGVPVAQADQGVVAMEARPAAGLRVGGQAWVRRMDGLALVAPRSGGPFATAGFATGRGSARGVALDAALAGARYGVVGSWGWQRVRYAYGDTAYAPSHGARHAVEAGAVVFPSPTLALRVAVSALLGRRATGIEGAFEWESCNLLDRGCEFAGGPSHAVGDPGGVALPAYLRADLGVRKHWHVGVGGRDALLAVYGTLSNVVGHANVLAFAPDAATGERVAVLMRPRSPLVVGVEWRR